MKPAQKERPHGSLVIDRSQKQNNVCVSLKMKVYVKRLFKLLCTVLAYNTVPRNWKGYLLVSQFWKQAAPIN